MKLFQVLMKVMMLMVKMPGLMIGIKILVKSCGIFAPSIVALSYISKGIDWKKEVIYQTALGNSIATMTNARP